jgi:RNA polymerase sigma factor (sigma-70 family)
MLLSDLEAEDVVQDVFIRMSSRWPDIADPRAYARTSVTRACIDRLRVRGHFAPDGLPVDLESIDRSAPDIAEHHSMIAWLAHLHGKKRAAVVLRYYLGWSHLEIADQLQCEESSARSLCARGVADLRRMMTDER